MKKLLTKAEQNKNHHTNYNYQDYYQYIKNVAYKFGMTTNIDIDEFISESGLVWTLAINNHKPDKCDFIVYFKIMFRQACISLTRDNYTQKKGKLKTSSIDKTISSDNNNTLHDIISIHKNSKINSNDIALLSDTAKKILSELINFNAPVMSKLINVEEKIQLKQQIKKYYFRTFKSLSDKIGSTKYQTALKEICLLSNGARPAKNFYCFPIITK